MVSAVMLAMKSEWPFAALYGVMAIAGGALARSLWINRERLAGKPPSS